jgi:hypothetical protein
MSAAAALRVALGTFPAWRAVMGSISRGKGACRPIQADLPRVKWQGDGVNDAGAGSTSSRNQRAAPCHGERPDSVCSASEMFR